MQQFESIFRQTLEQQQSTGVKTPVVHAIKDFYEAQKNILVSTEAKRSETEDKNRIIAEENLKYRTALKERLDMEQKKHEKKREEHLKNVRETEERKQKYVQEVHMKFKEGEKNMFRDRVKTYKEHEEKMQNFWSHHQLKRQHSHRSQTAVRSLYENTLDRKRALELRESDFGLNSKTQMLMRHAGREHNVYRQIQEKKENIHEAHNKQVEKNLQRHIEILSARETKFINDISSHFAASKEVLNKKKKQFQTKLKGKLIDTNIKIHSVRSNLLERTKNRSASLASCKCKQINNVEEGITKSIFLQEKHRSSFFTQTLKNHEKSPSQVAQKRNDFIVRSQSMRSTVNYNQQNLRQKKFTADIERLNKQKAISDALKLKKSIEIEGNCYVRLVNVK